eukprot:3508298-Amphidinium_carterae.1
MVFRLSGGDLCLHLFVSFTCSIASRHAVQPRWCGWFIRKHYFGCNSTEADEMRDWREMQKLKFQTERFQQENISTSTL